MKEMLLPLLIANLIATALSCGAVDEGAGTREPTVSGAATTLSPSSGNDALKKFMGDSAESSPYDSSKYQSAGGGPINSGGELTCDFESACCYNNLNGAQIPWAYGTGANADTVQQSFGTSTVPNGKFLYAGSNTPLSADYRAVLDSCSISCATGGTVQVTLSHWITPGVILEVCTQDAFSAGNAVNCQPIDKQQSPDPGPSTVTVNAPTPQGQFFDVQIIARGFTAANGGLAAIDDLSVQFTPCEGEPTSSGATTGGGAGGPTGSTPAGGATPSPSGGGPDGALCSKVQCNFEENSLCSYTDAAASGNTKYGGTKSFTVTQNRTGNSDTGVPKAANGSKYYAGVNLKPGESAVLSVEPITVTNAYTLGFLVYEATSGITLKVCLNTKDYCPFKTSTDVSIADRNWQPVNVPINASTAAIIFSAENTGNYLGAVGLDNIIIQKSGVTPGEKQTSACTS